MRNKREADLEIEIAKSVLSEIPDDKLEHIYQFFSRLSEFKKLTKLYDTYIEGVECALENTGNSRIYVNYNIDGTVTGRLSNSAANISRSKKKEHKIGVSFHTLPRENKDIDINIRDYVVAPEGWDFITADKKAMELRILAHVARERNMIRAFESGQDLHTYSAALTFNKDPEDITKEERQLAKEVSFLTVYGGTATTLAAKRNISEMKADQIIQSWMAAYPRVPVYMDTIRDYINQHKYAKSLFGRFRHLPNIDSPVASIREQAFRQGLNFTIQSPSSDILLCGMLGVIYRLRREGFRAKVIATVHDSIELISPKNETNRVVKLIHDELVNYYYLKENFNINLSVPLEVDIEVGSSFGNGKKVDPKTLCAS